ncbi:MAG: TonB-dependent receptor [Prevotellaceae bacterium]|jgi:outer membrane receptor protein involved in Fe transport|nr:TonB-dependent receptor [Prevotellaceae bacterium]
MQRTAAPTLTLTLLLLFSFAPLHADDRDTVRWRTVDLDEVVVTGFKQASRRTEPLSASSLSTHFLSNHSIETVRDLSTLLPNFFMPDYGSRQTSPIYVRGIGSKVNAPSVGLYVDGVPHFERSALDLDLSDISNVEVLRGPQGTLYGRNAIGGIINIYTRSPLDGYQGTRLNVGYGSRNDVRASLSNYTRLSHSVGFSASGNYHRNDGFFTNVYNGRKADNMGEGGGRLSLVWQAAPLWRVRLSATANHSEQGGYPYGAYDPATGDVAAVNYDDPGRYRRTIVTTGANVRYEGARLAFNSQTAYQYIRDRQALDQDFTPQPTSYVVQRLRQNMVSQELTLKSTTDTRYRHITGAFGFYQMLDRDIYNRRTDVLKRYDIPTYGLALYHQSTLDLVGGLSLLAGLRFDYENARERSAASSLHFSQFTPKVTLQYTMPTARSRHIFYATVARGYKPGGFNTAFETDDERTFRPEYNWNYELGAKVTLSRHLNFDAALFYIDWRDQQVTQTVPGVGSIQRNAGHSVSRGAELSLQAFPLANLALTLNYGYTFARFLSYVRSETVDYSHHLIPMVPRHTLALSADYTLYRPFRALDRLTISAGASGAGRIYWQEDNAVSQPFYLLVDLKVAATKGHVTLELWSRNLTQTTYNTYYFSLPGQGFAQRGKPLTVGTAITIRI